MTIGDIIKNYRVRSELSMERFAERSGLSKGYVSMLEQNRNPKNGKEIRPSVETIKKVSATIGITVDELMAMLDEKQEVDLTGNGDSPSPREEKKSSILTAAEPESPHKGYLVGYPDPPMSKEEHEHLRKYHVIPTDGKKRVDNVLDYEYNAFQESEENK